MVSSLDLVADLAFVADLFSDLDFYFVVVAAAVVAVVAFAGPDFFVADSCFDFRKRPEVDPFLIQSKTGKQKHGC